MKWLFFLLLTANAALFALAQLERQPPALNLASREINASAVRIVGLEPASSSPAADPEAETTPEPPAAPSPTPVQQAKASAPASGKLVCLKWQGLTGEQVAAARANLAELQVKANEQGRADSSNKVWVYIPPLDSLQQAQTKAAELKALGVDDYFVINDGRRWQNAISLGIFSNREAGERFLEELRAKGVRSAVLRERDDAVRPTTFVIRNATSEQLAAIRRFNAQYRGAEVKELACWQ
ncbi:SPOR domain-containing protein [Chitinilyticum litopenaei]|uniref:SPOR domain-containing protein n=1 Tax=Chitinilyticum litopenaei TaxID=1121276 RepID=UPI0003FB55EE|nr:SPOR domain-containing protein [Chitinilyticum litopenaei]